MRNLWLIAIAFCLAWMLTQGATHAQRSRSKMPIRALPPSWSKDVIDVFFEDAREILVGQRPVVRLRGSAEPEGNSAEPDKRPVVAHSGIRWSLNISADTIEDEIKARKLLLDQEVSTASRFKGGGYRKCRDHFSVLAVMFAVISEYDGDVRWKEDAASLREMYARAGFNCKVASDATYQEAKLRRQDLNELVRGGRVPEMKAQSEASWNLVADRPPLMRRIEQAYQQRMSGWLANSNEFRKNAAELIHEAELLATLALVIQRQGYEYWDDETYQQHSQQLHGAALEVVQAVHNQDYQQARRAAGEASKACSECHEGYRSSE